MNSFDSLKSALLTLKPEGEDGLEGLIAEALSNLMSTSFRLARAGRQHGRDGATAPGPFDVFFEAKLYSKQSLSTEDLQAKLMSAINAHSPCLDVWVLAATVSIGENTVAELNQMAEKFGVTLVVLDWADHPIPPLAALLSGTRVAVNNWMKRSVPVVLLQGVTHALEEIAQLPSFDAALDQISVALSRETVGLGTARELNSQWLQNRFSDRFSARQVFGQFLAPLDPTSEAIPRQSLISALSSIFTSDLDSKTLVAVLGEEGSGKTWLVATTWLSLKSRPLLLICASGHFPSEADIRNPLRFLARLLAEQTGGNIDEEALYKWERRLENWRMRSRSGTARIILLLDGVNERESQPWITLIDSIASIAPEIGLQLVITSRNAFYQNHLEPRLHTYSISPINVGLFGDPELAVGLSRIGRKLEDFDPALRDFIRNPRVFSIAVSMLDRLSLRELTRERLLFEYWKKRLEESGTRICHDDADMRHLLISHARQVRARIASNGRALMPSFLRDNWKIHSGLAMRRADPSIDDELTEIEEGRFFEPDTNSLGNYRLRSEALPYALGLLLIHELREASTSGIDVIAKMDEALDPVRGFDLTSEILLSAVVISCADPNCGEDIIAPIVCAAVSQQNMPDYFIEKLSTFVSSSPSGYIMAAEHLWSRSSGYHEGRDRITQLLFENRYHPTVQALLNARISHWLALWSREPEDRYYHGMPEREIEQIRREHDRHVSEIAAQYASLAPPERKLLELFAGETPYPELASIDTLAVNLLAGQALASFADGIVTWQLTAILARKFWMSDEIRWTIRLNPVDPLETAEALCKRANALETAHGVSELGYRTAMAVYSMTGRPQDAVEGHRLWMNWEKRPDFHSWRRVEQFCDTDPLDPESLDPTNILRGVSRVNSIQVADVRGTGFAGEGDNDIAMLTPGLARFCPQPLVDKLRELCRNVNGRKEFPLRQLSLHLAELTPLFSDQEIREVRETYERIILNQDPLATEREGFVAQYLLLSLLPHLSGTEQLNLLLMLPKHVALLMVLHPHFKSIPPNELERALLQFSDSGDVVGLRRVLFFATTGRTLLNKRAREITIKCFSHSDQLVRISAFEVATNTNDIQALKALSWSNWSASYLIGQPFEAFYGSRALIPVINSIDSPETLCRFTPIHLSAIIDRLNNPTFHALAVGITDRLLSILQLGADITPDITLSRSITSPETPGDEYPRWSIVDEAKEPVDLAALLNETMSHESIEKKWKERNERGKAAVDTFLNKLRDHGMDWLADPVYIRAIKEIAIREPSTFNDIVGLVERSEDGKLSQILNFGLCVAIALSNTEPERAAALLSRCEFLWSPIRIVIGAAEIPFDRLAPWRCANAPSTNKICYDRLRQASNDEALAEEVLCAEHTARNHTVFACIDDLMSSSRPADIARAVTMAGFCDSDDRIEKLFDSKQFEYGFLADIATKARAAYERNKWARHWFTLARKSSNGVDYWRYSELMIKSADARFVLWFPGQHTDMGKDFFLFHLLLMQRLRNRAKARAKKRHGTLFGLRSPSNHLLKAVGLHVG